MIQLPETYEDTLLVLTIEFDLARAGWVVSLTSGLLWDLGQRLTHDEPVYSEILIPFAAGTGEVDEYLNSLLLIHFERLGLLSTGW
jgi:hypothetical protein